MKILIVLVSLLVQALALSMDEMAATCKNGGSYEPNDLIDQLLGKESLIVSIDDNACFAQEIVKQGQKKYHWKIDIKGPKPENLKNNYIYEETQDGPYVEISPEKGVKQYIFPSGSPETTLYALNCDANGKAHFWIVGIPTEDCGLECARKLAREDGFESFSAGICDNKLSGMA